MRPWMMKSVIFLLLAIPAFVSTKKCTNPTGGTTEPQVEVTTTTEAPRETTEEVDVSTTPYYPPPEDWPKGRWALMRAGSSCPDFFNFKQGSRYQDSEDYRNGNQWTDNSGFSGKMKQDGYDLHFCSKTKKRAGQGMWPAGDYCIHRVGSKCPEKFSTGSLKWDDENIFNSNAKKGYLPAGNYNKDTIQHFCCRKSFYDDEDDENTNYSSGAHPFDSGDATNHRLHYCHYQPRVLETPPPPALSTPF